MSKSGVGNKGTLASRTSVQNRIRYNTLRAPGPMDVPFCLESCQQNIFRSGPLPFPSSVCEMFSWPWLCFGNQCFVTQYGLLFSRSAIVVHGFFLGLFSEPVHQLHRHNRNYDLELRQITGWKKKKSLFPDQLHTFFGNVLDILIICVPVPVACRTLEQAFFMWFHFGAEWFGANPFHLVQGHAGQTRTNKHEDSGAKRCCSFVGATTVTLGSCSCIMWQLIFKNKEHKTD